MSAAAQGQQAPAIEVSGLTKRFGDKTVVDGLSMTVRRGRICGFLGPNGSGKTTTIRMLCGLLRPDAGEGRCVGFDLRTESDLIRRHVGYMTQRFGLYEDLSIRQNLDFIARLFGLASRRAVVDATLERLGLQARAQQLAGTLSGGWKQRLALAACLMHEPQLLLLDEPTAGVDPRARRDFWDHIHALASQGITVLVSTHYMDEAERCHELVYLAEGRILAQGTGAQIIEQARLTIWSASGAGDLQRVAAALHDAPGVLSVAAFGAALHVAGRDAKALERAIAPFRDAPGLRWQHAEPNLEDAFIGLIARSGDDGPGAGGRAE